jgi:hypothetical protein
MFALILHPGDLSYWQLLGILMVLFALCVLPFIVIAFIIYKVAAAHSAANLQAEQFTTLRISEQKLPDSKVV